MRQQRWQAADFTSAAVGILIEDLACHLEQIAAEVRRRKMIDGDNKVCANDHEDAITCQAPAKGRPEPV